VCRANLQLMMPRRSSCLPEGYEPVMEKLKGQVESYGGFLKLMRRPSIAPKGPSGAGGVEAQKEKYEPAGVHPPSPPPATRAGEGSSSSSPGEGRGGEGGLKGVLRKGAPAVRQSGKGSGSPRVKFYESVEVSTRVLVRIGGRDGVDHRLGLEDRLSYGALGGLGCALSIILERLC
jgi:hypothetical protein